MEKQYLFCFTLSVIANFGLSSYCKTTLFKIYTPDVILESASEFNVRTSPNIYTLFDCASLCVASENCNMLTFQNGECSITRKRRFGDPILANSFYPAVDCPDDFTYDENANLCYKVIEKTLNYTEAVLECQNLDATLLRVDSSVKHNYIKRVLDDVLSHLPSAMIYIQGEYNPTDDTYYFENGDVIMYTDWNTPMGQPEKLPGEIYIGMRKNHAYRWHDFRDFNVCDAFVCEKRSMSKFCT